MINLNIYWQLFETMFKQRKNWYIPEPKPRKKTVHQELVRKYHTPGALIPLGRELTPYGIMLERINQQREDELEYIDKNLTEGLFYGTHLEKESQEADVQAEKAFEEMQEGNDTALQGQTRLQSLYPIISETWRFSEIKRTPYRMDSDDES